MASKGIKGITIAINGDATGLEDSLKDVNKKAKDTQSELREVEKALKMDPGNADLINQKMELLASAVSTASTKLEALRTAQAQVEQQFRDGDIGEEQYRAFQRELANTESSLRSYQSQIQTTQMDSQRLADNQRDLQTYLNATGQSVDDLSNTLGTRLTNAIRDGSASADQLDQALNRIARQAGHTGQNLDEFRNTLRNVDGSSLDEIRADLMRVGSAADEAEQDVKKFGDGLGGIVGGLAVGGGLAGAITAALDTSSLNTKIEMTMDLDPASAAAVRESVKSVTTAIEDEEGALEGVRRQFTLNADASVEENQRIIEGATAIAYAYNDIDFKELIQESHEIGKELGISQQEALGMVDALLKVGFPPDQLDIISEYGNQLKMAGFNALEIQAIMASGVDTGTWNIDNLLDGIKEGRIIGAEFGAEIDDATSTIIKNAGLSATKFQELGKAIASGGEEGSVAMQEMAKMLSTVEDATVRNQLGTSLFGTLWEEQGTKIVDTLMNMDENMKSTAENQEGLNNSVASMNSDPAIQLKVAFENMMTALNPLLTVIAEVVGKIASWAAENPVFTATLAAIVTVVGLLTGAFAVLMPAVGALMGALAPLGGVLGVLSTAFGALVSPIGLAVAAIALIGTALVTAYTQSETFREGVNTVFGAIKDFVVDVFTNIASFVQEKISEIKKFWDENGPQIQKAFETVFNAIKKVIEIVMPAVQSIVEGVIDAVKNVIDGGLNLILGIVKTFSSALTGDWTGVWEGIKQLASGAIEALWGILQLGFAGKIIKVVQKFGGDALKYVGDMWNGIRGKFDEMVSGATTKFNALKDAILKPIQTAKDSIGKIVSEIKGFFSGLKLEIPSIKLPKLPSPKITGNFSLDPPSVPKISWNALGGVFNKPTILQSAAGLQGVGEAGSEAIIPLKPDVLAGIGKGIAEQMNVGMPSTIVVQSVLDGRVVAETITPFVSQNQQSNTSLKAMSRGVQI